MPFVHAPLLVLVLAALGQDANPPRIECRAALECRQLAAEAAAQQDFEAFHDLAWRAVQLGPKNDPGLMYLLARAQSLSGRPGDALVMLRRLVDMGVPIDAATNEDFRRVRALPRWAELGITGSAPPEAEAGAPAAAAVPRVIPPPATKAAAAVSEPMGNATESLRFTTAEFTPAGLAYDAVSRRFVVGDRHARKLAVVDEFSRHVANLAGSGFGEISALEIDPNEGYLWVVSSERSRSTLHKLQLISGRLLSAYPIPEELAPVSLADVAVPAAGNVLALDSAGHRLFRLRPRAATVELAAALPDSKPSSLAPADEGIVYVADETGIVRVDLTARSTSQVKVAAGVDVRALARIRWHRGALVGIQKTPGGTYRALRISLDRSGRTVRRIEVLDPRLATTDPTAATVVGGTLYYLASGEGTEMIIRRVALR